ncbi:MAG: creatininase family protein [Chloroflexota bacterium]|nr:creatininase family protein [Chloroflexota bacterium]
MDSENRTANSHPGDNHSGEAVAPGAREGATGPILLSELTSPAFALMSRQLDLVLIPVGAHEQHGPALPVSTDTFSAQVLSGLAGALLRPQVAVAPAIPWGVSWHHLGIPGTISLRDETLVAVVEDVVRSLHGYGIERFLIVNTHGGNNAALQLAVERCHHEHGVPVVASVYAYSLIANAAQEALGPDAIGHGGGDESAVVLAIRPDLVELSSLGKREVNESIRRVQTIVRAAGGVLPIEQHRTTVSGVNGDSTHASAEAGQVILGKAAGQLRAIAEELIDVDIDAFRK